MFYLFFFDNTEICSSTFNIVKMIYIFNKTIEMITIVVIPVGHHVLIETISFLCLLTVKLILIVCSSSSTIIPKFSTFLKY